MGQYINQDSNGTKLPAQGKVAFLLKDGATIITTPNKWEEGLVCVVDNGAFEAAAYAYDYREMGYFVESLKTDGREAVWLKYPKASELAGLPWID